MSRPDQLRAQSDTELAHLPEWRRREMGLPAATPSITPDDVPYLPEGPQPLVRENPPSEPFPIHALGPLQEAVEAAIDMVQAPVALAAQSALAVASLAVQGFADVETLGSNAPASLFCLTIAESGERKSTVDRLLMHGVREYEAEQRMGYQGAIDEHQTEAELWQAKRKKHLAEAAGGKDMLKAAEAEADLLALGPCPRPPLVPNLTCEEPTLEGLLKLYQISRPALGLFTDEGGGFIGGHGMSQDNRLKTIAGLSRLWGGDVVTRVRAGDGTSDYPGRRLAAHLMVQPVAAYPLLADPLASGQGFLARFLMTEPPSEIGFRLRRGHDAISDRALAAFSTRLRIILSTPLPTGDNPQELEPRCLPLSQGARELLWRYYVASEQAQAPGGEMEHVRPYASKSPEQAARIAAVLTLCADLDTPEVAPSVIADAIELAQFYLGEARRLAEAGLVSEKTAKAEALGRWLLESWPHDEVTPSEIMQRGPNSLRDRVRVAEPLAILVKAGWLVPLEDGTVVRNKARREAYRIVRHPDAV